MNVLPNRTALSGGGLRTVAPLLALLLLFFTAACAERTDTAGELEEDTAMVQEEPMATDTAAVAEEASLDETISLLEGDLTTIAVDQATSNIESWQNQLRQQDDEALTAIADNLEELQMELEAAEIDGNAVGELLTELGEQTTGAAGTAEGTVAGQLTELGNLLTEAGQQLTGGAQ